jgi:hypothetical protein
VPRHAVWSEFANPGPAPDTRLLQAYTDKVGCGAGAAVDRQRNVRLFRQRGDLGRSRRGADDDGSAVPEEPDGDDAWLAVGSGVRQTRRVGGVQELQRAGLLEIPDASGIGNACVSSLHRRGVGRPQRHTKGNFFGQAAESRNSTSPGVVAGGAIALAGPSSIATTECDTPEVGLGVVFSGLGSTERSSTARNSRTGRTPTSPVGDRLSGRT